MSTQLCSAQYPSSERIISWKFTALSLTARSDRPACVERADRERRDLGGQRPETEAAVILVRGRDHAERLASAAIRQAGVGSFGERPLEEPLDSEEPVAGERQRTVRAGLADRSAGRRRVAGEARLGTAVRTARHVRQVSRQPEQLQLEREHERVEARRALDGAQLVEEVEESHERAERPLVRFLLGEQAQHRLGADEPGAETVRVLTRLPVRPDQLRSSDRLELSAALVQHELDVAERLESPAEARLRFSDALRDGADPPTFARVEVKYAIRLAETKGAQHHGLGLVRAAGHVAQV